MKDESIRRRLMTTLSAAVRIGRSGGLTDSQVGAELQDLADLYLAAVEPIRMPTVAAWQLGLDDAQSASPADAFVAELKEQGIREVQPFPVGSSPPQDWALRADAGPVELVRCGFELPADSHIHHCQKAPGHADGPGGSDHSCEMCGALYDANGGEASPLAMGVGLPLAGNGPAEEFGEME